jgi:zinc protease
MRLGMQTKSVSLFDAMAALKEEVAGIVTNPPTDDELSQAKEAILNAFVFNYDSKAGILAQQMSYAYYGLPSNYLDTYRSNIEKVTKDDVVRVAKKYVHTDELAILIVGKAGDFPKPLDTLGTVTNLDITIPKKPAAN